jgi:bifunctional DNase/RNase
MPANMIPVKVDQLFLSNVGFVVLLKGSADERSLPIFIGEAEAQAIALRVNGVEIPRPLTHDLLKNMLDYLECRLMRIEICDLKDGTFYANLVLERDGAPTALDCRPSDAIALALRCGSPIFVSCDVMDEAGRVFDQTQSEAGLAAPAPPAGEKASAKKLTALETLTKALEKAIAEERYEDAARLRDDINLLKESHKGN